MKYALLLLAALALALGAAGCDDDGDAPAPTATAGATAADGGGSTPINPAATADPTAAALAPVQAVVQDLAGRFDQPPEAVTVVSVTPMEWPDACLGVKTLQNPDEVCAQVITPGYEVVLSLGSTVYTYRTDQSGENVRFSGLGLD